MTDRKTLDVYEDQAERYAGLGVTETQAKSIRDFLAYVPQSGLILDVGCGPGLHAARFQEAGFRVDAFDATPAFVETARAAGVNARLATFDDIEGTKTHDGIWASFSLLHAPRASVPGHIAALARALKPGGAFFLGMKLGQGQERDGLGRSYAYFSVDELTEMLQSNGLNIADVTTGHEPGLAGTVDPFALIIARKPEDA